MKQRRLILALCLAALLLSGCTLRININKNPVDLETIMAESAMTADPAAYSPDGTYEIVFRYAKGGLEKMDLSRAYVGYFPKGIMETVQDITGEADDIPPLPADAQSAIDAAEGADTLKKIAVIRYAVQDDTTVLVSFRDPEKPLRGRTYWFIVPDAGIGGPVTPE